MYYKLYYNRPTAKLEISPFDDIDELENAIRTTCKELSNPLYFYVDHIGHGDKYYISSSVEDLKQVAAEQQRLWIADAQAQLERLKSIKLQVNL